MKNINNKLSGSLVQNCQQKAYNVGPTGRITLVSILTEGNIVSNYPSQNIFNMCINFNVQFYTREETPSFYFRKDIKKIS